MKVAELAQQVCKREGHKSEARKDEIKKITGIISDLAYENAEVMPLIIQLGISRAKKKKNASRTED